MMKEQHDSILKMSQNIELMNISLLLKQDLQLGNIVIYSLALLNISDKLGMNCAKACLLNKSIGFMLHFWL